VSGGRQPLLRAVIDEDLPVFYRQQADPESVRMAAVASRDEPAFMAHWRTTVLARPEPIVPTIVSPDGAAAGHVVCFELDGKPMVGYWIGREYWGQGLATRALQALLEEVARRPLYAIAACHNIASLRVLEKCGFVVIERRSVPDAALGIAVDEAVLELR
jgi:RimJ/RimL family protein N-acetyltransferase